MATDFLPRPRTAALRERLGLDSTGPATLLVLFLVVDVLLIGAHLTTKAFGFAEPLLDLGVDRGYGEFLQYIKTLWSVLLLVALAARRRVGLFIVWALVGGYLGLDDALGIHEQAGFAFARAVPSLGSAAVHIGELLWIGSVGTVLAVAVLVAHRRARAEDRAASATLVVLFGILIVFGVVVDAVHHLFITDPTFDAAWTALEDGGEIVVMTVIVAFVFARWVGRRTPG